MFFAPGFEEVEALAPLDLLRRAGLNVKTVAIGGAPTSSSGLFDTAAPGISVSETAVTGAHGITIHADMSEASFCRYAAEHLSGPNPDSIEAVVLPGGMPGTSNLDASPVVDHTLEIAHSMGAFLCAICAAPLVLGKRGYLTGKRATCYPGFETYLEGATVGGKVIRDGKIITAAGMGVAQEFGLELISVLVSPEKAGEIRTAIQSL